ncbi:MAG: helix-turn-helix domain-containing protein, partial [Candidatus Thorarchaeota archaeon]
MRDLGEISDDNPHLEKRGTWIKDSEEHSLTTEERDEIIRRYNIEHSSKFGESSKDTSKIEETKEREVKIWRPQIKGIPVDSEDESMTILQDIIPGIFKHHRFEIMKEQIFMHMKTIQEFGHRKSVTKQEIRDFAKQNSYLPSTIEAWVLQKKRPKSYQVINENALTKEKGEVLVSEIREKLQGLETQDKLDLRLDSPYHESRTRMLPKYKKDYENACGFYRFLDELVDGGLLSDIANRVGIDRLEASRYVEEESFPRLIRKVLKLSLDEIEGINKRALVQDEVHYDLLLCKNPHIRDKEGFSDTDRLMRGYLRLREMQQSDTLPEIPQEELAERLNISFSLLNQYLSGKIAPRLQSVLLLHENSRLRYEGNLSELAFENRIEPALVFKELHQFRNLESIDVDTLVTSLSTIYEKTDTSSKVRWLDLHGYAPSGQEWFKQITNSCTKDRSEIELALNQQLGFDEDSRQRLRLGVVSSRIYLRLEDIQETDGMQLYNDKMFHFHDLNKIDELLSGAKARLGIKDDISLGRLVHQVTDHDRSATGLELNTDLH